MKFLNKQRYIFLIVLIGLSIFLPLFITKTFFAGGDIVYSSPLIYETQRDYFQEHNRPLLWNSYIFAGIPLFANVIAAPNYPINMLSVFLNLPLYAWINLSFLVSFVFAGIFTYLFSRKLKLNQFSSFVVAIIFMFSHAFISRFAAFPGLVSEFLFLAANFFFLENFLTKKDLSSGIFLSIFLSLGFLAGHTQFFLYSSFALFSYFIYRVFSDKEICRNTENLKKVMGFAVLAGIIFLGLISIQLIPTLEYSKYSWRTDYSYEEATKGSLPPLQLITSIIPNFFGNRLVGTYWGYPSSELTLYIGILPLLLAIFALIYSRSKIKYFFTGLAIFSILFAFGKNFPLFYFFYKFVPGFYLFNSPSRMLIVYSFAMAILAGLGIKKLLAKNNSKTLKVFFTILLSSSLLMFFNWSFMLLFKNKILNTGRQLLESFYYGKYSHTYLVQGTDISELAPLILKVYNQISFGLLVAASLILVSAILFYIIHKKRKHKAIKLIILAILFIDIFIFALPYLDESNIRERYFPGVDSADLFSPSEEVLFLKSIGEPELFRIYDNEWIVPQHLTVRNKVFKTTGHETIATGKYFSYLDSINLTQEDASEKLGLLNVKYVFSREKMDNPNFLLIKEFNQSFLYENQDFLPRFYIIDENAEIKKVNLREYNSNKAVLIANGPGTLVFSDTYYPGWRAFSNNTETKVLEYKNIIKSIELEKGENEIEFVFDPKTYFYGRLITFFTLSFLIFLFIYFLSLKRTDHC